MPGRSHLMSILMMLGFAAAFVFGGMAYSNSYGAPVEQPAAPRVVKPKPKPKAMPAPAPAPASYVIKRVLDIPGPFRPGDWYWDEAGAPADGPMVVTVDLAANTVSIFRGGYEIGTAVIIYGADEYPTPLGVFPITEKDADHVSNIYDAPMPYMLRLTNDGVSIHGSKVGPHFVTHGCIGVPIAFAKKLFGVVKLGDKVIVTRGEMLNEGGAITAV